MALEAGGVEGGGDGFPVGGGLGGGDEEEEENEGTEGHLEGKITYVRRVGNRAGSGGDAE
jgi:hypothetical protein